MHAVKNKKARATYDSVLLAVYGLADAEGLYCYATNEEIAAKVCKSKGTVRDHIDRMEQNGDVITFGVKDGLGERVIIILDHADSGRAVAEMVLKRRDREQRLDEGWDD
jgi:hypothetical protein